MLIKTHLIKFAIAKKICANAVGCKWTLFLVRRINHITQVHLHNNFLILYLTIYHFIYPSVCLGSRKHLPNSITAPSHPYST